MEHDVNQHINASHEMFVPSQFGTFPGEHSQSGIRPYMGSSLPDVESDDDLFLFRYPDHPWLLDTRPGVGSHSKYGFGKLRSPSLQMKLTSRNRYRSRTRGTEKRTMTGKDSAVSRSVRLNQVDHTAQLVNYPTLLAHR